MSEPICPCCEQDYEEGSEPVRLGICRGCWFDLDSMHTYVETLTDKLMKATESCKKTSPTSSP